MNRNELTNYVQAAVKKLGLPPEGRGSKSITSNAGYYFGRRNGSLVAEYDYYVQESHDSDDSSNLDHFIPARMGYERVLVTFAGADIADLINHIQAA